MEEVLTKEMTYRAKRFSHLNAPYPMIIIKDSIEPNLSTPFILRVNFQQNTCLAFAFRSSDIKSENQSALNKELSKVPILVSSSLVRAILPEFAESTFELNLEIPSVVRRKAVSAIATDLPDQITLQYHKSDKELSQLCSGFPQKWALVSYGGLIAPVKLVKRNHVNQGQAEVRCSMAMRSLWQIHRGNKELIQISPLPRKDIIERVFSSRRVGFIESPVGEMVARFLSALIYLSRLPDLALEIVLRFLLRAPQVALRVTQAPSGDDGEDVVRINPSVFPLLGIKPGHQVLLQWGNRTKSAIALEELTSQTQTSEKIARVELLENSDLVNYSQHLIIRVSSSVRLDLGCPVSTVLIVRRRVRPVLIRNLVQLVIPVAGTIFAAAALDNPPWGILLGGLLIMTFLGLAPARYSRPPRGLWP